VPDRWAPVGALGAPAEAGQLDGYGCYRRGDVRYGFPLEYDRGTERASQYAAKLAAYHTYRTSGEAARDYAGFPDVLFVITSATAEERMITSVERVFARYGDRQLSFLTTTTDQVEAPGFLGLYGAARACPERPQAADCGSGRYPE
jgi:hypothetical protein